MKQTLLFLWMTISLSLTALSQDMGYKEMMKNNKTNFYDVISEANRFFQTHDKNRKGSGYKPFMRWVYNNEYKYYPSGERDKTDPLFVLHAYKEFLQNTPQNRELRTDNSWVEIGPRNIDNITNSYSTGLGRIEDVYADSNNPSLMYVASRSGGLWKTIDGGQTWTVLTDGLFSTGVNTFGVNPNNTDEILINLEGGVNGYSYGIYRSTDGGNTWVISQFTPDNVGFGGLGDDFRVHKIFYHPLVSNLVFLGTNRGIYRSDDNLQTWTRIHSGVFDDSNYTEITDIAFHPTNADVIYLIDNISGSRDKIYISTDQGLTFSASATISDGDANSNTEWGYLATSAAAPNNVYFASSSGVWKSTDMGSNFTFLTNPSQSCAGFEVSDDDNTKMIYGYLDIMASDDEGVSWTQVTHWSLGNVNGTGTYIEKLGNSTDYVHADLHPAKYINGSFYIGTDGFFCKSSDDGNNWQILSQGVGTRENYKLGISQSNNNVVILGSQDNGTTSHGDNGWVEVYGADGMDGIVQALNDQWMVGSTQYGNRQITNNGGVTLTSINPSGTDAYWAAPILYDPNDQMTLYDFRETIWKSTDFGSTWIELGDPFTGSGYYNTIMEADIAQNNSGIMVVSKFEYLMKSTDGGNTFTDIKGTLPNGSIRSVKFAPHDDNLLFVTYAGYQNDGEKVFMSDDGGTTWQNITYNLGDIPVHAVVIDNTPEHNIFVGTEIGVFRKTLSETTWAAFNNGLPQVPVRDLEINFGANELKAASWGRGLWTVKIPGRDSFPDIVKTSITSPPTLNSPKQTILQYVTSEIEYAGTLNTVQVKYSINTTDFDQTINMSNSTGNIWVSDSPLPDGNIGDKVFFKVVATGSNADTSETYKFMYTLHDFAYCDASGNGDYDLHITNVTITDANNQEVLNNSSANDMYHSYETPIVNLGICDTYTITVTGSSTWDENDYAAWIDYNRDAEFTIDERVLFTPNALGTGTAQFTVPNDAFDNLATKLRVRMAYWGDDPTDCGTFMGEVEDYVIQIQPDTTAPIPDVANLPDINSECEVTSLTTPTATDNCSGSITATSNVTLPITAQGTTVVTWSYEDDNGNDSTQLQNIIITPIDNTVVQNGNTLTANATGSYTYQWGDCSSGFVAITGETEQSFSPTEDGFYAVEINNGTCSVTSDCVQMTILSLNDAEQMEGIKIYPNSSTGRFDIEFDEKPERADLLIYDIHGKLLLSNTLSQTKNNIDIQSFAKGVYLLKIKADDKSFNLKIIKE